MGDVVEREGNESIWTSVSPAKTGRQSGSGGNKVDETIISPSRYSILAETRDVEGELGTDPIDHIEEDEDDEDVEEGEVISVV